MHHNEIDRFVVDIFMCTFTIVFQYDLGNAHGIEKLISPKKHFSDEVIHVAGRLQTKDSSDLTRLWGG